MSGEERNQYYYRQAQDRPLAEVLAEFRQASQRLIEVVEAHAEEFLIQPSTLRACRSQSWSGRCSSMTITTIIANTHRPSAIG